MATKNNLDVGGEAPHHTELAARYRIGDGVYDLTQIVAAVKGEQSNDDWNARTMGDRLDAIKAYLKDQDAEKVDETENTAGDGETVRSATGEVLEHAEQMNSGADTPSSQDRVKDQPLEPRDAEMVEAVELVQAGRAASGPVETLRAFKQEDEAVEVEELISSLERTNDMIEAIRQRVNADGPIADAIDALFEKLTDAENRATVAEQDASQLRDKVRRLEERSTRDKPLHGAIEDLKAPY